jgi:hypothetical protein
VKQRKLLKNILVMHGSLDILLDVIELSTGDKQSSFVRSGSSISSDSRSGYVSDEKKLMVKNCNLLIPRPL